MKFPLRERPFAPLQLSLAQCETFERTARALVLETVDEFDHFVRRQNRAMDPKVWKLVKARESVSVYQKRELEDATSMATWSAASNGSHSSNSSGTSVSAITKWALPKLLAVGTIPGDFDDVMYGMLSPDESSTRVKTAYVDDELVDCEVLQAIQHGSMGEPFRFLSIKWIVKASPSGRMGRPRDFIVIEATGVYTNASGERYGYHVAHSIDVPQCPKLDSLGILRGKLSSCVLFKQHSNRSVEMFMRSFVDHGGSVSSSAAIATATNTLFGFCKSVDCAERKKLVWLLREANTAARAQSRGSSSIAVNITKDQKGRECCALCSTRFSTFRSPIGCELCRKVVCSKCESSRRLTFVDGFAVKKLSVPLCKDCITNASTASAADFARKEYVPGAYANHTHGTPLSVAKAPVVSDPRMSTASSKRHTRSTSDTDWSRLDYTGGTDRSSMPVSVDFSMGETRSINGFGLGDESTSEAEETMSQRSAFAPSVARSVVSVPSPRTPLPSEQQQLWLRMQELRLQAEQTYQITAENYRVMSETMGPKKSKDTRRRY